MECPREKGNEFGPDSTIMKYEDQSVLGMVRRRLLLRNSVLNIINFLYKVVKAFDKKNQYFGLWSFHVENWCDYFHCTENSLVFH